MRLAGIAACVPKRSVPSTRCYEKFPQLEVDRIIGNTGVHAKREAEPGVTAMDLCILAARPLIEQLDWAPETIDAVIFITMSPDYIMPASAHRAHVELGLGTRCMAFDINLGCSGFSHGMIVIESLIASGMVRRALLMCGEMTAGTIRPRAEDLQYRSDLANSILFGDAGATIALSADGEQQVKAYEFGADGKGLRSIIVPGGASREFWTPALFERRVDDTGEERRPIDLIMKGTEVMTFALKRVPPLQDALYAKSGWKVDDVDAFVFHQANRFMLDTLARRMKIPAAKLPLSLDEFGNTSSVSIPLTMVTRCAELLRRPAKWSFLGFGVGLSFSGMLMETDGEVVTVPLIEV